jgi:prepilin-type N-terminal cleavage/methylation domain-containing protein
MASKFKHGFSLIELSIVILIIGILIAGVTQSSRLIKEFRLKTAQNLTQSSPVVSIKDLALWYETSLDSSLIDSEEEDGLAITTWYDINPQISFKNNAVQATSTNQPSFRSNVFNSAIPAIRFDGADNFMTFDGSILVNTNYTIFVVEQRRDADNENYFLSGTDTISDTNLHIGYRDTDSITQDHFGSDLDYTIAAYTSPIPRIHTFLFNTVSGKKYWLNGGITPDATQASQTVALSSYAGASIGRYGPAGNYLNGDIAEIIIFTRTLKTEERQAVEAYLSKKYAIIIS